MPNPIRKRWAFLVGINQYTCNYTSLNYCVDDVLELEKVLEQIGYICVCLHDRLDARDKRFPTRDNILAELDMLSQKVEQDDLLLAYFACHGSREVDHKPRLIATDTRKIHLATKGISIPDDLEPRIKGSKAQHKILMLDACFIGQGRGTQNPAEFIRRVHEVAQGYVVLAASTEQQEALESSGLKHSIFCHHVLRALCGEAEVQGRNCVTVSDLQNYVLEGMREYSVRFSLDQEPQGRSEGNQGDFILADYEQCARPSFHTGSAASPATGATIASDGVQGRGKSPSQLINCLWSLNYVEQGRVFEDHTPRSRRATAFVIQARDSRIQHWLVKRLFHQLPNVKNARTFPFVIPAHPMWKTRNFDELWIDLGRRLECDAESTIVLNALVATYQTQPVILAMCDWQDSQRSRNLQQQVLAELWKPLVEKVKDLPNQPSRSRLILFLAEGSARKAEFSDDLAIPIRLTPLTEITSDDVATWLESDSVYLALSQVLNEDGIKGLIEQEILDWDSDPTQTLQQICYVFGMENGIADIESEWRLAG